MPIYAYKCGSCGHAQDVLRKLSDAPLTDCPVCGAASFTKQVTAAGFHLKGSGWYVTDFRDGAKKAAGAKDGDAAKTDGAPAQPADGAAKPAEATAKPAETTAKPAEGPASAKADAPKAS